MSDLHKRTSDDDEKVATLEHQPPIVDVHDVAQDGKAAILDSNGEAHLQYDPAVMKSLVRKLDIHCIIGIFLMYTIANIDRTNIGNAKTAKLEVQLGMSGSDYNLVASIFYVPYILGSLVSNIPAKWMGPSNWLCLVVFSFGLVSLCMAFVQNLGGLIATRMILGLGESAMHPGMAFHLSRFYTKRELTFRISLAMMSVPFAGVVGGFIAAGVLSLKNIGRLTDWRMLFFVEGLLTIGIATFCWFITPHSLERVKWLTEEERELGIARLKADNAGSVVLKEKFSRHAIRDGILNPFTIGTGLIFGLVGQCQAYVNFFLPSVIQQIFPSANVVTVQLLTTPIYAWGAIPQFVATYLTQRIDRRAKPQVVCLLIGAIGWIIFLATNIPGAAYTAAFFAVVGIYPNGPISLGWSASNAGTDSGRALATGLTVLMAHCGNLIGTWTTLPQYAPRQYPALSFNLFCFIAAAIISTLLGMYGERTNKRRANGQEDHKLDGLTQEEVAVLGHRHPRFMYKF